MKLSAFVFVSLLLTFSSSFASFDDYFESKTLRIDYIHSGNITDEYYAIDELKEESLWGGSKTNLVDTFNYGNFKFVAYDKASGKIIFSKTYSSLFAEWRTTDEGKICTKAFSETITMPYPKATIKTEFYSRDKKNNWNRKFEYIVDPANYFISHEKKNRSSCFKIAYNGDPSKKLDIVFIPDGYDREEMSQFKKDCDRFAKYILDTSPYKENKDKINIWGIEVASYDSGPDIPGENIWKRTAVGTTFYTFDSERYLMTYDNKTLHDVAANAPYDQIFIIVNTDKYGGGGIYNFYCTCAANNINSNYVSIHEFGHAFAGLGDEYYTSEVPTEDLYPKDVEPWEPNLTTLVNFDKKWKSMLGKDVPIPTPADDKYKDTVGVYEGGGYETKGVYRPMQDCSMKSISYNNFCPVCKKAIQDMIDFYTK
ncbi:MAG: M64 family metallopeptidase [Bacteroidales bacterium]